MNFPNHQYDKWRLDSPTESESEQSERCIEFFPDGHQRWILRVDGTVLVLSSLDVELLRELVS